MKKSIPFLLCFLLVCALAWGQTGAANGLVTQAGGQSVDQTVELLKAAIAELDLKVIAEINHGEAASKNGLELRPTHVLLFGNPQVGTKLMQADQRAGLDLPLRVLVWQNEQGEVMVSYHDPVTLSQTYQLEEQQEVVQKMKGVLEKLAQKAGETNK